MNANTIFSLCTRLSAILDHSVLRRHNIGFALEQPFSWSLINTAAVMARIIDEYDVCAEQLDSSEIRADLLGSDFPVEKIDQMVIKMASLRHFNRQASNRNEVGMGQIMSCLRFDTPPSLEEITLDARKRVVQEVVTGRTPKAKAKVRFLELRNSLYQAAEERKAKDKRLQDEVFFLCNRSDDHLFVTDVESDLESGKAYHDHQLVDYDQYEHVVEGLLEKMASAVIRARTELQITMDRTNISTTLITCNKLMTELEAIGTEIGIDFGMIQRRTADIEGLIDDVAQVDTNTAESVKAELDTLTDDEPLPESDNTPVDARKRVLIKSPERLAREEADAKAAALTAKLNAKAAQTAAKARATRAKNATAS